MAALALASSLTVTGFTVGLSTAQADEVTQDNYELASTDAQVTANRTHTLALADTAVANTESWSGDWGDTHWIYDAKHAVLIIAPDRDSTSGDSPFMEDAEKSIQEWFVKTYVKKVVIAHRVKLANKNVLKSMFSNCPILSEVEGLGKLSLELLPEEDVVDLSSMFSRTRVSSVDFTGVNFGKRPLKTNSMFYGNPIADFAMKGLPWENLLSASNMFACSGIKNITVGYPDTVVKAPMLSAINQMFMDCKNLSEVDWRIEAPNVIGTYNMFFGDTALTSADLNNLKSQNILDSGGMFQDCTSLEHALLGGSKFSSGFRAINMFSNAPKIKHFSIDKETLSKLYRYGDNGRLPRIDAQPALRWYDESLDQYLTFAEWAAYQTDGNRTLDLDA
ncbi:BspA family leucine-rich repeat surface protein [Bifidobacterium dolichotidis]|nr:BspA family leucine-rich repeat surface protein [Bifidobacterium dolichotidis]